MMQTRQNTLKQLGGVNEVETGENTNKEGGLEQSQGDQTATNTHDREHMATHLGKKTEQEATLTT